jgi:hypothetical protein
MKPELLKRLPSPSSTMKGLSMRLSKRRSMRLRTQKATWRKLERALEEKDKDERES